MSKVAHNELRISLKIFWTQILRSDMSDVVTKVKIWRVEKREGEYKRSLGGWDENVKAATPMKGPWFSVHVTAGSETKYKFYILSLLYFTIHSKSPILITRTTRPAQLAELPRSEFDPELFPHSAYVKFCVTFVTKVPYLTFCDKMWQFLI